MFVAGVLNIGIFFSLKKRRTGVRGLVFYFELSLISRMFLDRVFYVFGFVFIFVSGIFIVGLVCLWDGCNERYVGGVERF